MCGDSDGDPRAGGVPGDQTLPHHQPQLPCAGGDCKNHMLQEQGPDVTAKTQKSQFHGEF